MQYHSEFNHHHEPSNDRTPWNIADRTGDSRVLEVFRRFARLREELVPYLVARAERSVRTGRPLLRPLFFDHADDKRVWDWPMQWHLGRPPTRRRGHRVGCDEVAGVAARRRVGRLLHWERHTGPAEVDRPVPIDEIPVYRRLR